MDVRARAPLHHRMFFPGGLPTLSPPPLTHTHLSSSTPPLAYQDPSKRLTAQGALTHPWMLTYASGSRMESSVPVGGAVNLKDGKGFAGSSPALAGTSVPGSLPSNGDSAHARSSDGPPPPPSASASGNGSMPLSPLLQPIRTQVSAPVPPLLNPPSRTLSDGPKGGGSAAAAPAGGTRGSFVVGPCPPGGRGRGLQRTASIKRGGEGLPSDLLASDRASDAAMPYSPKVFTSPVDPAVRERLHAFCQAFHGGVEKAYVKLLHVR